MKIMIITTPEEIGGGETYVKNLVKGFPHHQFLVLTSLGKFYKQLKSEGIQTKLLLLSIKFFSRLHIILFILLVPLNIIQYLFFLLIFNPDIVHIQSREEQILVTPLARILGKKVIWTLHGPFVKGNKLVDFLFLGFVHYANKIIAVSNFVKDSLPNLGRNNLVTVIYHGVDLNRFKPATTAENSKTIIGYSGRLVEIKRPELFLEASIEVLKKLPGAEVWIAGEGSLKIRMEERVSELLSSKRIKFLGFKQDIENVIKLFTVLVVTSKTEGLDIAALEAIASGVPVVAVDVGALPEIINKETGLLVDSDNPKIIASQIVSFIQNTNLLSEVKKSCRKVAEQRFSLESMLRKTDLMYGN